MTGLKLGRFNPAVRNSAQSPSWYIIGCLMLVFPWGNPAVPDAGSTILIILVVGGLALGWNSFAALGSAERYMLFAFVALVGIAALTLINTEDLEQGVKYMERYVRIAGIPLMCLLLLRYGAFPAKALLAGCALAGPLLAIQAWYQTQIQGRELARGAYHHIVFGDLAALAIAIVLVGLITLGHKRWHYGLGLLSVVAGIVAVLLAGARNAWLFLALMALLVPWLYRRALGGRRLAWVAGALALLILAVALWKPPLVVERLADGLDDLRIFWQDPSADTSLGARLNMWRSSILIFARAPVLGAGIGDFQTANTEIVEKGLSYDPTLGRFSHAHNIYFHALAEMGIVGFTALMVSLFFLPLRYFYVRWRDATEPEDRFCGLAGFISVFAFAVFGIGETWLARNPPVNAYAVSVAVFMAGLVRIDSRTQDQKNPQ
jgi:O-antigen ligase